MDILHHFLDSILEARLKIWLLVFVILEILFVFHEQVNLNIGDFLGEVLVHQDALLIFADV
jgi:hypothetical protein